MIQREPEPRADAPVRPARRPDESMTLLTEVMDRPLDPAYAAAAARAGGQRRARPWNSLIVALTAVAAGALFVTSGLAHARPETSRDSGREHLVARIEERRREVEDRSAEVARLREQVGALEAGALAGRGVDTEALAGLAAAAGDTPVTGPGLRITLDDAAGLGPAGSGDARAGGYDDTGRIVYRDLQQISNELWAAGAEAIAINGHRLTSTSAIRFAGSAILVNFRPLARPYVVDAIMGEGQQNTFRTGAGGDYLAELRSAYSARADARPQPDLYIPAADSTSLRFARAVAPDQPPTGTTTRSHTSPGEGDRKDDE